MTELITGPSAGITGGESQHTWSRAFIDGSPELAKALIQSGRRPRAGHDRKRWETVNWDDYRAHVGVCGRKGPWRVEMVEDKPGEPSQWVAEADGLPFVPGWYTALAHDERGLVMSDLPAEIAGCLPFLDRVQAENTAHILISGLGLGIVPAWLLRNCPVIRVDVIEIDSDVIDLVARDEAAKETWAADPRLHVHLGDALTLRLGCRQGCALHGDCVPPIWFGAAWHDIWDQPSAENLLSMRRLHRRFGTKAGWQMSWERPECEYQRRHPRVRRGLCIISEDLGLEASHV
jgi:hypothetical protein